MKTPIYETSPGAGQALLATRQFAWCGLYKVVMLSGNTYYYTTADVPVVFGGHTYQTPSKFGAIFKRGKIKWRLGLEVDTLDMAIYPNGGQVNGRDIFEAIRIGDFDAADVTFMHAYWPSGGGYVSQIPPTAVYIMFAGTVGPVTWGRTRASFTINGYLDKLNIQLPRNLYGQSCKNTLGDSACTVNLASFSATGTASTGSTVSALNLTVSGATGIYNQGKITFTSGQNAGLSRTVKEYVSGSPATVTLNTPFPYAPASTDAFTIYQGCNKTQATCTNKFSNLDNFRGEPYIPDNSTAV